MRGPVKAGRELRALGDDLSDPRRYRTRPSTDDLMRGGAAKGDPKGVHSLVQSGDSSPPAVNEPTAVNSLESQYGLKPILAVPIPARQVVIMNQVVGTARRRVDTAPRGRLYIHFANMSQNVIWIHTSNAVTAGTVGYPLAAMTGAAAWDGGTFGIDAEENVQWWAVSAAGLTNMLVVVETSRK